MVLFVVLLWLILLAVEWYYWLKWHKSYFRLGLPFLKMKVPSTNKQIPIIKAAVLNEEQNVINISKLSIRKISNNEAAVRNKFFLVWPIRGRLIFNQNHSVLKLQIYIDWFMFILYLYVIAVCFFGEGLRNPVADILGVIGGSLAFFYVILIKSFLVFIKK